jgi:hypothetical protein
MSDELKLKPCPFCGGDAYEPVKDTYDLSWPDQVWCKNEDCPLLNELMLREEWNTRPVEAELLAALEWVTNIACGVSKGGGRPETEEHEAALEQAQALIAKHGGNR